LREGEVTGSVTLFHVIARPGATATPTNVVEWFDTPAALRAVKEIVVREDVIGLDVETALDFGTLCLIQVATRRRTFLIDPFAVGDLGPLGTALCSSQPVKIIHNAQFDRRVLAAFGITLDGVFDIQERSMNRDDVHTRQWRVQRKMLNLKRLCHPDCGKIWTMVDYRTIQPRRFGEGRGRSDG
jgi:hypothetical protein